METKINRQKTLLRLLREEDLSSQEAVVQRMRESGCPATQPCISRDFRELGIVKLGGRYVSVSSTQEEEVEELSSTEVNPWSLIRELTPVGAHLLVAKTAVGAAALIATELDNAGLRDVIGTIAGDDTVFIAVPGEAAQRRIEQRLRMFGTRV